MTKRATAADVLLRAAQLVDCGEVPSYFLAVGAAAIQLRVYGNRSACGAARKAALFVGGEHAFEAPKNIRVLTLLFARELVLSGDV